MTGLFCQLASGRYNRGASYGIQNGWKWFVENHIRRWDEGPVLLHLPFGRTKGRGKMRLDGLFEARTVGQHWWFEEFVEAIKDLPQEIIAYLGRPGNSGIHDLPSCYECLRPILDANIMSVAFDNLSSPRINPTDIALTETLESLGLTVYTEATAEYDHIMYDRPQIIRWPLFVNRHLKQHPAAVDRFPKMGDPDFYDKVLVLVLPREMEHFSGFELDESVIPMITISESKKWYAQ